MDVILLEIIARLQTLYSHGVEPWNNQADMIDEGMTHAYAFPCYFVEINVVGSEPIGNFVQNTELDVTIHILDEKLHYSEAMATNYSIFSRRTDVHRALTGWKASKSSPFFKTDEKQDFNHTNLYHYTLTFKTSWIDDTAAPAEYYTAPPTSLNITHG